MCRITRCNPPLELSRGVEHLLIKVAFLEATLFSPNEIELTIYGPRGACLNNDSCSQPRGPKTLHYLDVCMRS